MLNNGCFTVPILFLIFNRPDTTQEVFNQIKLIKPSVLFVAADGPRPGNYKDIEMCLATRDIIKQVDWPCDVKLLLRDNNLGCGLSVSSAISWFFSHVDFGIILEDDCLPNLDFFIYCKKMLEIYKDNTSVMQINAYNPFGAVLESDNYFFTKYPRIWGWATWKRAWEKYDFYMEEWTNISLIKRHIFERYGFIEGSIRIFIWSKTRKSIIISRTADTWDYQWNFSIMLQNGICVQSASNLVKNIGFQSGTHFNNGSKFFDTDYGFIKLPLKLNPYLQKTFDNKISKLYLLSKFNKIIRYLPF